jgi:hypothetical protein
MSTGTGTDGAEIAARPRSTRRMLAGVVFAMAMIAGACNHDRLPGAPNCNLFPLDNYWHTDVRSLPVHPKSSQWVNAIGFGTEVHMDFGSGNWEGFPIGIPYTTVPGNQPRVPIEFEYWDESDPGPYPIPPNVPIEGDPEGDGDRHALIMDRDNCMLYEVYAADRQPNGTWEAGSGAVWDMRSNDLHPDGWTSADAAGLPMLPGLVRYDEVAKGRVGHAIRFTAPVTRREYIWPARHYASDQTATNLPPMGAWFRLKSSIDPMDFPAQVRPIVVAMQVHGIILADNGSPWYMSGVPDSRWNNDLLHELDVLEGSDFQAVNTAGLIVHPDSGAVAPH